MSLVYLNGQFLPRADARLSVDERGFFFGDGVYEVTRVVRGRLFEWDRHARRLARGLRELRIDPDSRWTRSTRCTNGSSARTA